MVNRREAIRTITKVVRRLPPAMRPLMICWYTDCEDMNAAWGDGGGDLLAWAELGSRIVHICPSADTLDDLLFYFFHECQHLARDVTPGRQQSERLCDRQARYWLRKFKKEGLI